MVSGLVTSPCDQLRIFSGDARLIRIASKSAIVFCISNGLERNKGSSAFPALGSSTQYPVASTQYLKFMFREDPRALITRNVSYQNLCVAGPFAKHPADSFTLGTRDWVLLLIRRRAGRRLLLPGLNQLHVEAERLQLADQHVKRFRHARLHGSFALDDGLVNLGTAVYVVGLRRQQFLQYECRAVSFQRPNFHLSEALAAELRLATQRLLGDQ